MLLDNNNRNKKKFCKTTLATCDISQKSHKKIAAGRRMLFTIKIVQLTVHNQEVKF